MGNAAYEQRRMEDHLRRQRAANEADARQRRTEFTDHVAEDFLNQLASFLQGKAYFSLEPGNPGSFIVRFIREGDSAPLTKGER